MAEKSLRTPTFAWTHTSHFGNWATAKPTYEYAIIFTKKLYKHATILQICAVTELYWTAENIFHWCEKCNYKTSY